MKTIGNRNTIIGGRHVPVTGTEAARARRAIKILPNEIHTTTDQRRLFVENILLSGGVWHGEVTDNTAMLALNSTAAEGCWPRDMCEQPDGSIWRCVLGRGTNIGDWRRIYDPTGGTFPSFTGNAGEFLRVNATEDGVEWANPSAGGAWELLASDPMTALANWTAVNGTWAVGGGGTYIEQNNATNADYFLRFNTPLPLVDVIRLEVFISSSGTAQRTAGAIARWDGTSTITEMIIGVIFRRSSSSVINSMFTSRLTSTAQVSGLSLALDTWHELTVLFGSDWAVLSCGGVQFRGHLSNSNAGVRDRIGVTGIGSGIRFRNFRAYGLPLPT